MCVPAHCAGPLTNGTSLNQTHIGGLRTMVHVLPDCWWKRIAMTFITLSKCAGPFVLTITWQTVDYPDSANGPGYVLYIHTYIHAYIVNILTYTSYGGPGTCLAALCMQRKPGNPGLAFLRINKNMCGTKSLSSLFIFIFGFFFLPFFFFLFYPSPWASS